MPTPDDIRHQQELLTTHRRTLATTLQQQAALGSAYAPPIIEHTIQDCRRNIARIKATLRGWGVPVDDHPDDTEQSSQPLKNRRAIFVGGVMIFLVILGAITDITGVWSGVREVFGNLLLTRTQRILPTHAIETPHLHPSVSPQEEIVATTPVTLTTCTDIIVTSSEVLVRKEPSIASPTITALQQGDDVSIICNSEINQGGLIWVKILVFSDDKTILSGWVPAQDVT